MVSHRFRCIVYLVLVGALSGCSAVRPFAGVTSGPFFTATAEDAPRLALLAHELDGEETQVSGSGEL